MKNVIFSAGTVPAVWAKEGRVSPPIRLAGDGRRCDIEQTGMGRVDVLVTQPKDSSRQIWQQGMWGFRNS